MVKRPCPECGCEEAYIINEDIRSRAEGRCPECDWEEQPRVRETGLLVRHHWYSSTLRRFYEDRGDSDRATFFGNLKPPIKYDSELRITDSMANGPSWAEPDPEPLPRPSLKRHRTGTCFDSETPGMRTVCVEPMKALLEADVALHEVRHQRNGYHTDLVFADVDAQAVARRDQMTGSRDPLHESFPRFKIWWWLYEKGPKLFGEAIDPGVYSDSSKNERHVNWLVENGWAAVSGYEVIHALVPEPIAELHAVELKLRDWEKAMEQAARASTVDERGEDVHQIAPEAYGPKWLDRWGYADYRWVALDVGGVRPALENEAVFRETGVGLIAVAEGGTVHKLIDAEHRPRRRYTRDRAWAESEVWAKLDIDEWAGSVETEPVAEPGRQSGLMTYAGGDA